MLASCEVRDPRGRGSILFVCCARIGAWVKRREDRVVLCAVSLNDASYCCEEDIAISASAEVSDSDCSFRASSFISLTPKMQA